MTITMIITLIIIQLIRMNLINLMNFNTNNSFLKLQPHPIKYRSVSAQRPVQIGSGVPFEFSVQHLVDEFFHFR